MPASQVPEFVMSLLHSSVVHQVALATFQQPTNNNDVVTALQKNTKDDNSNNTSDEAETKKQSSSATTMLPLICATADKATEFYHRLETLGFTIGLRTAERLLASTPIPNNSSTERPQDDAINLVRTVLWPSLFGKELGRENDPAAQSLFSSKDNNNNTPATTANLVYKLIDVDFSWVRSVGLLPDSPSLADPFIRGMNYDLLEDASSFAAGISSSSSAEKKSSTTTHSSSKPTNQTGPNDYVVLLTGMILGFLSSLGFGSHAERRVFGGDRATISSTLNNNNNNPSASTSAAMTPNNNNINNSVSASSSAVVSRPPSSFVTVRHRLLSREGEPVRPSGMQLKLVVHFT